MCLAIPAKVIELKENRLATVDILGVTRDISIDLTPQASVGDFVLVHAGFAIEVVDPDYAQETIDLIKDFPDLVGDELPLGETDAPAEGSVPIGDASTSGAVPRGDASTGGTVPSGDRPTGDELPLEAEPADPRAAR